MLFSITQVCYHLCFEHACHTCLSSHRLFYICGHTCTVYTHLDKCACMHVQIPTEIYIWTGIIVFPANICYNRKVHSYLLFQWINYSRAISQRAWHCKEFISYNQHTCGDGVNGCCWLELLLHWNVLNY